MYVLIVLLKRKKTLLEACKDVPLACSGLSGPFTRFPRRALSGKLRKTVRVKFIGRCVTFWAKCDD